MEVILKILFCGEYDPDEPLWLKLLRLVPVLCCAAVLILELFFIHPIK